MLCVASAVYGNKLQKALINCLRGMKRKARGAREPRHIWKYVEVTSTAQRRDSPAQAINQHFLHVMMQTREDLWEKAF